MTRVAVVSTGSPDYLIDIVGDGFLRLLGRENVHLDFNTTNAHSTVHSQLYIGFSTPNAFPIYDAEYLVVSVRTPVDRIVDWVKRTSRAKVAVVDGEDDGIIRSNNERKSFRYFKREFYPGTKYEPSVRPLPMASIPEAIPEAERTKPVFMMGKYTHPDRKPIWAAMTELGFPVSKDIYSKAVYNKELASSLIGVSARGVGWDTYRYWETPYFGALLMSQRPGIEIPGNFREDDEAIYYGTPAELKKKVQALLSDRPRLDRIAAAGKKAAHERHLSTHRAATILRELA